jgi:glycosyltransferase involved in cell wall biosynthesis
MAVGPPAVASDLGGVPELLGSGAPTWLRAPFDRAGFAIGLGLERASKAELDDWDAALRSEYEGRFTPARGLENLEFLYRDLVGTRPS